LIDVTTWTAHASREPSEQFLAAMDRRWRDGLECPATRCEWSVGRLHSLALLHLDRAAHKRRLRAIYVTAGMCDEGDHGFTPMSDLVPGDMYGPEAVRVVHTGDASPLAAAIAAAKDDPYTVAATVITEAQFVSVDTYDDHSASLLNPATHGAVIPFIYAPADESADDAYDREDLLRANGFSTYTIDVSALGDDPIDAHRHLAGLLEDVFDEIAHLKADSAGRVMSVSPLWPMVVVRAPAEWEPCVDGRVDVREHTQS